MSVRGLTVLGCLLLCLTAFAAGGAQATEPVYPPGITGLPDGRIYEEASPFYKNGNFPFRNFGLAAADGNGIMYGAPGAMGEASSGMVTVFASTRTPQSGWQTASTTPHPNPAAKIEVASGPVDTIPSADFKRFLFAAYTTFVADDPPPVSQEPSGVNIFLSEDPLVEPAWLGRPLIAEPIPALGQVQLEHYVIAGASANLDTAYFTYAGTLVPEDASRAPNVRGSSAGFGANEADPWGMYEWSGGRLVSAGVLPNGQISPFGAVPAGMAGTGNFKRLVSARQPESPQNQVSEDGSRVFFVSPDPSASTVTDAQECSQAPPCSTEAPQLYVREPDGAGGKASVLVSASQLPGHEGEPAAHGVTLVRYLWTTITHSGGSYAFASPDGSHVFFASTDRLTQAAPEDSTVKEYVYDVDSGALTYLPGFSGPIGVVTGNGGEALFENRSGSPRMLELWRSGASGGSVTTVAELPDPGGDSSVNAARVSADGSVFVFRTNSVIPGGFNNGAGTYQIYRYDASTATLDCVSCPPVGVSPNGEAGISHEEEGTGSTIDTRGMSSDGLRVFFDTPIALVRQDTNGVRDVYEWEEGHVYLISSGINPQDSTYLDNSESGGDVFFATTSELVSGDVDGGDDVYDARVPHPGDNPPAAVVPCKGSVCQGPPSVPDLLGAPASATFSGVGNLTSAGEGKAAPRALTRAQKLARALRECRKKPRRKRAACEARARKRYAVASRSGASRSHGNVKVSSRRGK